MKMDIQVNRCGYCNKASSTLKYCGRCKNVRYCTRLCQSSDWTYHKHNCHINSKKKSLRDVNKSRLDTTHIGTNKAECDEEVTDGSEKQINGNNHVERDTEETDFHQKIKKEYSNENDGNGSTINIPYEENDIVETERSDKTTSIDKVGYSHDDATTKENELKSASKRADDENKSQINKCAFCSSRGCSQKCSRCKDIYYCSKECQKQDWKTHKITCKKKAEDEDKNDGPQSTTEPLVPSGFNIGSPFFPILSPEHAPMTATRPKGSLSRAIKMTKKLFPAHKIVTNVVYVPSEPSFSFFPFLKTPNMFEGLTVFVAFMNKYHEHVMRHAVCLLDDCDNRSKVEFYIDCDDPSPFFSYSQVKPGGYICITNAAKHLFRDGSVGFRIDKPEEIKILDIEILMK